MLVPRHRKKDDNITPKKGQELVRTIIYMETLHVIYTMMYVEHSPVESVEQFTSKGQKEHRQGWPYSGVMMGAINDHASLWDLHTAKKKDGRRHGTK